MRNCLTSSGVRLAHIMCKSWQVYSYDLQFVHLGLKFATSAMD